MKNIATVPSYLNGHLASTGFCILRPKQDIDNTYIFNYVQSERFLSSLNSKQRGTSYPAVRDSDVLNNMIALPPFREQRRIVQKIESIFAQIDAVKEFLDKNKILLKQSRQSVLKSAFEGKLTKKWNESNQPKLDIDWFDYNSHKKNIEKNKKNFLNNIVNISNRYCWIDFNAIIDSLKNGIYKPKNFYSDKGIACLRMYNIENNKIVWKKIKRMVLTVEEILEYQLLPNDILINRSKQFRTSWKICINSRKTRRLYF